jgi:hypothetical protein
VNAMQSAGEDVRKQAYAQRTTARQRLRTGGGACGEKRWGEVGGVQEGGARGAALGSLSNRRGSVRMRAVAWRSVFAHRTKRDSGLSWGGFMRGTGTHMRGMVGVGGMSGMGGKRGMDDMRGMHDMRGIGGMRGMDGMGGMGGMDGTRQASK